MNNIAKDAQQIWNDVAALYRHTISINSKKLLSISSVVAIWTFAFCFDSEIRFFVQSIRTESLNQIFGIFHWYGKAYLSIATILFCYLGGVFFSQEKMKSLGFTIFESFVFSGIVVTIIKSLFGRWRPYTEHGSFSFTWFTLGPNEHLSLPSGDVAIAFAFSVIIARAINNKVWQWIWYLIAIITSLGRVYHDQHWMSDIILASVIAIYIGEFINSRIQAKK